jgi:hypothetical protein
MLKGLRVLTMFTSEPDKSAGACTEGKGSGAFFFDGAVSSIRSRNVLLVGRETSLNANLQTLWVNLILKVRISIGREYIHVEAIEDMLLQKLDVRHFRKLCYYMAKEH